MFRMALLKLRESQIMKIRYLTGICAVCFVAIHILFRVIMPFGQSLEYHNVIALSRNTPFKIENKNINTSRSHCEILQRQVSQQILFYIFCSW